MSKIIVKTKEEFEKNLVLPKIYEFLTSKSAIIQDYCSAKERLKDYKDGVFYITNNTYEWFVFEIPNKVKILFYPHKNTNANVSTRIRNQSSKDIELFNSVMESLQKYVEKCHYYKWDGFTSKSK